MDQKQYLIKHKEIIDNMHDTTARKNADYCGASGDPFHNFKMVESLGITDPATAILVRMSDKMARITSFLQKGELKVTDETVMDTCVDLANYSVILAIYLGDLTSQKAIKTTSDVEDDTSYYENKKTI